MAGQQVRGTLPLINFMSPERIFASSTCGGTARIGAERHKARGMEMTHPVIQGAQISRQTSSRCAGHAQNKFRRSRIPAEKKQRHRGHWIGGRGRTRDAPKASAMSTATTNAPCTAAHSAVSLKGKGRGGTGGRSLMVPAVRIRARQTGRFPVGSAS